MNKYEELKSLFEKTQNEESAIAMAKYMRDLFLFYGVPANQRKEITKPFIAEAKAKKVIDWELLDLCYPDPHREMQYFVNDYLVAMSKYLTYDDIPHLLKYVKAKQW